jgi:MFS family permease
MTAGAFFAAGVMSFEFLSYHLARIGVAEHWLPALLALGTAAAIIASLVLGRAYDRIGIGAVVIGVVLSSLFSPLLFFGSTMLAIVGVLLWGVGYAVQDTLLKALIASVLPRDRRNAAFGVFYLGYGGGWLIGSIAAGVLYDRSRLALVIFAVLVQLASVPLFVLAARQR